MNVIVISPERAKERRQLMVQQLESLGIEATIMDAVDGEKLAPHERNHNIVNLHNGWRHGEPFTVGEIGCLMSHIKAIRTAKENGWEDVIVLEDDVVLSRDFKRGVQYIRRFAPPDMHHVLLSAHIYLNDAPPILPALQRLEYKTSGSYAYMLREPAYDTVLDGLSKMQIPADDTFETLNMYLKINSYIFFPFIAYPNTETSYIWGFKGQLQSHPSIKHFRHDIYGKQ